MNTCMRLCAGAIAAAVVVPAAADQLLVPSQYPTIQAAIDAALPGDVVVVADGVYTGDGNRDLTFAGKDITVRSANGPETCIIDCQASQQDPHRGFTFDGNETPAAVLEGFTIRNGSTPEGAIVDEFNGAGILITTGSPTIRECIITGNWAGCWGAAICCSWSGQGSPTIVNCVIAGNFCDDDGGAIFCFDSSPTIIGCMIVDNDAGVLGGGITHFGGGTVTVINSTIAGNTAGFDGAAVYGTNVQVVNSIIWDNTGGNQLSGALSVSYSDVQGGYAGEGNLSVQPRFVDPASGDYHLLPESPLVDAGDPGLVPGPDETDLDGDPRLVGVWVDIGADEMRRPADLDADGVVGIADLLALLGSWGPCVGCPADLDGDGVVGITDLLTLLADWD